MATASTTTTLGKRKASSKVGPSTTPPDVEQRISAELEVLTASPRPSLNRQLTPLRRQLHKPNVIIHVVLVVVNDIEFSAACQILTPFDTEYLSYTVDATTFFLGKCNTVPVALVQSAPASDGKFGSCMTTLLAIQEWQPAAVICVGVAYGIHNQLREGTKKPVEMGDVLVSSEILAYDHKKVSTGRSNEMRHTRVTVSEELLRALKQAEQEMPDGFIARQIEGLSRMTSDAKIVYGPVLSGGTLVNSVAFVQELLANFPEHRLNIVGGEMEGAGLADASTLSHFSSVAVIKGICDWGCRKSDDFQFVAASNAMKFVHHALPKVRDYLPKVAITLSSALLQVAEPIAASAVGDEDKQKFNALWEANENCEIAEQELATLEQSPEYIAAQQTLKALKDPYSKRVAEAKRHLEKVTEDCDGVWKWTSCKIMLDDKRSVERKQSGKASLTHKLVKRYVSGRVWQSILAEARADAKIEFACETVPLQKRARSSGIAEDSSEMG